MLPCQNKIAKHVRASCLQLGRSSDQNVHSNGCCVFVAEPKCLNDMLLQVHLVAAEAVHCHVLVCFLRSNMLGTYVPVLVYSYFWISLLQTG
jgi:hypothetical protein